MKKVIPLVLALALALPADAARLRSDRHEYLSANLLAIFYHEFGHALIDIMKLPIFGQEEDAADVLSVFLIDTLFDGETAISMARHTALGFLGEAKNRSGTEPAYWDVHGPDLQRYYTFVCLFYGADPAARQQVAEELELPEPRQRTCEDEYNQARQSWGPVIEKLYDNGPGRSIRFLADHKVGEYGRFTASVLEVEIDAMNKDLSLPKRMLVRVEECGVANAFYDSKTREIIMCTEFARYLHDLAPNR
ncbi:DUF4344 domain-containing metallopeptidase [Psychromarinibacter sp. C21-152]|uniref:DUF4344 domain-containing metallopeptidase n=1 Tax=Psychromarinibacter sediminicola TaxID=3033385 RepID=A0AAE3NRP6_9RHOB|nr:DUF4344 domain-containing metallopeptidase [Psychromarinibacter sediminicola]MDF0602278.1 DUF4344 domain-containing metallopeptidase [Psychromarinibacter sediminicola]